jgi:hypothetical protein
VFFVLVSALAPCVAAEQPGFTASGHWEGAVQAPNRSLEFQVDLAGEGTSLQGAISIPAQNIRGLPLTSVAVDGNTVRFAARSDQTFTGLLSADGKSIAGTFKVTEGEAPFTLARTGDAHIEPPARSPAVGKELEGTWNGTLKGEQTELRLVLTIANRADGAEGRIVNLDEGGLQLPLKISQSGSSVTLDSIAVPATFAGTLNADGTELAGTFRQGQSAIAVTFHRAVR